MPKVLVIDDDRAILALTEKALEPIADVVTASTAREGLEQLHGGDIDVVLLDIRLPDQNGLAVYCEIREIDRRIPVIFMTIEAASGTVIEAMQLGAFDYIAKPLSVEPLRKLVQTAIKQRQISSVPVAISANEEELGIAGERFIGRSPAMLDVFKAIGKVSQQDVPILIRGESGTGKELVARAIFQHSHRANEAFLAVNCAALPANLLESELFGHEKGAFTGADSQRVGKFEQCNGGTLFLDEIGDMAPAVQAKVLRVLQEQRFERVGGNQELTTDVRVIAATNRPLEEMVEAGEYREDLLYRLNGVTIELPPLRERLDDVPALVQSFLVQAKQEFHKPDIEGLAPESVQLLTHYDWPGNVRQLRAVIRRAVLDSVMPVITAASLPEEVKPVADELQKPSDSPVSHDSATAPGLSTGSETLARSEPPAAAPMVESPGDRHVDPRPDQAGRELPDLVSRLLAEESKDIYSQATEYMERYVIAEVLRATDGNQSQAADLLGITRGKLRDRIHSYQIKLKADVRVEGTDRT